MLITHEGIIEYWLSEPKRQGLHGDWRDLLDFTQIPFPDLQELTASEREGIRRLLEKHPEYLLEIWCKATVN